MSETEETQGWRSRIEDTAAWAFANRVNIPSQVFGQLIAGLAVAYVARGGMAHEQISSEAKAVGLLWFAEAELEMRMSRRGDA